MQELYRGSESAKNLYLKEKHRAEELNRELVKNVKGIKDVILENMSSFTIMDFIDEIEDVLEKAEGVE
ncbi:hypothetical protein [Wukongibacter sp. M2B1]|uniref:hypothetical protein n=1 Tax=Wukongibacter sp. M2B1 TaxID=3088895 RepID=UPI003D7A553D